MTTFSKCLLPTSVAEAKRRKRIAVAIRVRHHNKVGYITTGVDVGCTILGRKVQPNWLDGMVTNREPEWLAKNQAVEDFHRVVERRYERMANPGLMDCRELCKNLKNAGFVEDVRGQSLKVAVSEYLEHKRGTVSDGYCQMVEHSVDRICSWVQGDLALRHISQVMLQEYRKHLTTLTKEVEVKEAYYSTKYKQTRYRREIRVEKALSAASINKELAHLKAVVNYAISVGLVKYDVHPFAMVTIPRSASKETDVEPEAIQKLRDAELVSPNHQLARDVFMLSFYLGGMNYKDILSADFSGEVVTYCREKTKTTTMVRRTIKVPIVPEAREILERRTKKGKWCSGLRYTSGRDEIGYIGKHLKEVVQMLGLPSYMTFYSARKSFSQFALDMGINDAVTDYLLGHSDARRGVISYYSRVTPRMAGVALRRVIDYMAEPEKYLEDLERAILG